MINGFCWFARAGVSRVCSHSVALPERLDRIWPSLVALIGTAGVVFSLLSLFSDDVGDSSAEAGDAPTSPSPTDSAGPTGTSTATTEPTSEPTDEPAPNGPTTAPPELRASVGVLNNASIAGLAGRAQARFEEGGWEVTGIDTLVSVQVEESTVYYPTEEFRESAEAFAAQFPEVGRVEPRGTMPISDEHLVVVLATDYSEEASESE